MKLHSLPPGESCFLHSPDKQRTVLLGFHRSLFFFLFALGFHLSSIGAGAQGSQPVVDTASQQAIPAQVAQTASSSAPKDPPVTREQNEPLPGQQTKRILGIIPNFRSVSTDVKLPPESVKEKFMTATDDSFDYSSVFVPALLAGYSDARKADPEFGHGAIAYGRYFWHSAVDQTSENYMVEFILPTITHEDNRYYTLGRGGFFRRTGYALSRSVVTRNDAGNETFNISEVFGAGASAGISNLYYPSPERSFGNTASQWGLDIGIDSASFLIKEFWPDINRKLFHSSAGIDSAER